MGSRLQFWINHLRRIDAEGISIASYARREQLSVHSLYSARHQLRKSQSVKKPATRKQAYPSGKHPLTKPAFVGFVLLGCFFIVQRVASDAAAVHGSGSWAGWVAFAVAVGTPVSRCPPHRSVRAELPHTAPTSGITHRIAVQDKGGLVAGVGCTELSSG